MSGIGSEARGIITAGALVGLGAAAVYVGAPKSYFAGIVAQGLPLLAAGFLILGALYLAARAPLRGIASLAAAAAVGYHVWAVLAAVPVAPSSAGPGATPLRVVSFNLLNQNPRPSEDVLADVLSLDADVLVIMEGRSLWPVRARLRERYPYGIGCDGDDRVDCGSMIVSRLPVATAEMSSLSGIFGKRFVKAIVETGSGPVTVAGIHLTKFYIDMFSDGEMARAISDLRKTEGPLIVAGDFNSSSLGRPIRAMTRALRLERAASEPSTWPVEAGDWGVPIDHLFVRGVAIESLDAVGPFGSNHRGLSARLSVPAARRDGGSDPAVSGRLDGPAKVVHAAGP